MARQLTSASNFNSQTELAKERNRVAADRTLLAWIRCGITLISFGFGLDQILQALYSNSGATTAPRYLTRALNLALIELGCLVVLLAIVEYQDELRRLHQLAYRYTPRMTIGMVVTPMLILLAIGAFLLIGLRITV
jgi:putative membrane protein